jgi:hypothetical protein
LAGENRLEVHLREGRPPVRDAFVWNDLGCPDLLGRALASSGFDEAEDAVPDPFEPAPSSAGHCDGLVAPGDRAKLDLEQPVARTAVEIASGGSLAGSTISPLPPAACACAIVAVAGSSEVPGAVQSPRRGPQGAR